MFCSSTLCDDAGRDELLEDMEYCLVDLYNNRNRQQIKTERDVQNATCFAPYRVRNHRAHTPEPIINFLFRVCLHLQWVKERKNKHVLCDAYNVCSVGKR